MHDNHGNGYTYLVLLNLSSNMILAIGCWIFLITFCQSKVIEVNSKGNDSMNCCVEGECVCASLPEALSHIESNNVINITSSVSLNSSIQIGNLNNITIISNGVTVMCNNSGNVAFIYCSNVLIKGITWDRCGNPNDPYLHYAIDFIATGNVSIRECTFQHSEVCQVVNFVSVSEIVVVANSRFLFNIVINSSLCENVASLAFHSEENTALQNIFIVITETVFYHNGALDYDHYGDYGKSSSLFYSLRSLLQIIIFMENLNISTSLGVGGNLTCLSQSSVPMYLTNVTVFNNSNGGLEIFMGSSMSVTLLNISSSVFTNNVNGALSILIRGVYSRNVILRGTVITGNTGTFRRNPVFGNVEQVTGILMHLLVASSESYPVIDNCTISDNVGKKIGSIVHLYSLSSFIVMFTSFTNNVGTALRVSGTNIAFVNLMQFMNNIAQRGAAIYLEHGSQIIIGNSNLEFIGNIAERWGGAIYVELPFGCMHNGVVFRNVPDSSYYVSFINNSAGITGNSIYFSIPDSCDAIKDSMLNEFHYSQALGSIGPHISTSPYKINVCSTSCDDTNSSSCYISNRNMLGQSVNINATVCDYYGNISETVQFYIKCTNCNNKYRLSDSRALMHNGLFDVAFLAVDADSDIVDDTNVTLSLSSVLSDEYRQLTATVSVELSSCQSGYVFDPNVEKCICYEQSKDVIRCQQDYAEIKHGYWFGVAPPLMNKVTVSLCPIHYCSYEEDTEISNGYYRLPEEFNSQCSSHRLGTACGECKSGYTLSYDSPDCINKNKCSAGMTVLVVVLTILYWVIVVILVFGLMQRKISLGYTYGLLYYYSIIDILLGSNLYISDGVFQLVTILSSFAKLTPQFLGRLCFVQGLRGIDQLFIHYFHAFSITSIIIVIVIATRRSPRITVIVSRCIIRVICLLILLSYTSLASTSLQLLRPLYFDDVNGAYVYSSPSIKYFTGRHIPYGIIALLCGLFIVIGLPLLLLLEPFLKHKLNFIRIKPLLDQYQECYKDQYHWFAAYYLVCRLIVIAIVYIGNFNDVLYYLQTVCVITILVHAWIKPYQSAMLNVLDGIILLMIVLVVNLNSFTFSRSSTITIAVLLVIIPLILSCFVYLKTFFCSMKCPWNYKKIKKV